MRKKYVCPKMTFDNKTTEMAAPLAFFSAATAAAAAVGAVVGAVATSKAMGIQDNQCRLSSSKEIIGLCV